MILHLPVASRLLIFTVIAGAGFPGYPGGV